MNDIKGVKFSKNKYKPPTLKQKRAAYQKFLKDDVDWDWSSILKLLIFKLGRVRECICVPSRASERACVPVSLPFTLLSPLSLCYLFSSSYHLSPATWSRLIGRRRPTG